MSDERPLPLVPAEVDLKDYDNVPIEFRRLFTSDTWTQATDEEKRAAFCLWCESWHGTPASSLPDNERQLAHFSQSGPRWPKIRDHVMRGWVKCSDGRWYHPVVAEKALEAWARHKKASSKGKAGALKRWGTGIAAAIKKNGSATNTDSTGNARAIKKHSEELERKRSSSSSKASTRPPGGQTRLKNIPESDTNPEAVERNRAIAQAVAAGDTERAKRLREKVA